MSVVYIYGLIDPRNDEIFYIGFTGNIEKRYNQHLNINGKKREKNLYKDNVINKIIKLGLKPKIKILDSCDKLFNYKLNMYEHEKMEIFYIKKYKENGIKLTNLTIGGDGGCTYHKTVYQYNENGIFIKKYNSVNEIADFYNVNPDIISKVINQRSKKSYRATYLFSSKERANSFIFRKTKKDYIPILQYSFNGKLIAEYKSQREASKITNVFQSNINHCLKKKRKHAGGFIWKYKNNNN